MSSLEQRERALQLSPARTLGERLGVVGAFVALALVDLLMKVLGFARFYRLVRGWPTRQGLTPGPGAAEALCATVDRAAVYYFKRAWCLQRSATTACLLRRKGIPAQLVIGVERFPFYAHAWVEVDGRVVNDSPQVKKRYTVIERC